MYCCKEVKTATRPHQVRHTPYYAVRLVRPVILRHIPTLHPAPRAPRIVVLVVLALVHRRIDLVVDLVPINAIKLKRLARSSGALVVPVICIRFRIRRDLVRIRRWTRGSYHSSCLRVDQVRRLVLPPPLADRVREPGHPHDLDPSLPPGRVHFDRPSLQGQSTKKTSNTMAAPTFAATTCVIRGLSSV